MTAPLLLFGGTFDPPHRHHRTMALRAMELLGADELLLVPARINPQRSALPPAPAEDRLEMVRRAFAKVPRTRVSEIELRREGPSFTVDTLRELRRAGEARPIRLLLGSDQALNFRTWREPQAILEIAAPAVVLRPPHTRESFGRAVADDRRWLEWLLPIEPIDCSSTEIRRRIAADEPLADLVEPAVEQHIRSRGLYGACSHRPG